MIEYIDGVAYKWCPRCEDYVLVEDFHKHKGKSDGLRGWCKECYRKYVREYKREYYENNRERANQYQREYRDNNRERVNQYAREYYQNNPDKYHQAFFVWYLNAAVRDGKIIKPNNCSICGSTEQIEGHHPDYEPGHELIVVWVCRRCHADIHREQRNGTL